MAELKDNVNHPSHYTTGSVECIDALKSATSGLTGIEAVCTANAIKYLWRWKHKNGAEDLKKAQWYIGTDTGNYADSSRFDCKNRTTPGDLPGAVTKGTSRTR